MNKNAVVDIWGKACSHLQAVLHPDVYSRWIAVIAPVDYADNTITLSVDNDFYQTWLEENYLPLIKSALSTVTSTADVKVVFAVKPHSARVEPAEPPKKKPANAHGHSLKRGKAQTFLNNNFTFDTFVVGSSNNFAHAASLAVAQAPARAYNPLFIYGSAGLGKTHLMQAIGHHVLNSSRATVCYLSSESLMNEYIAALQSSSLVQFRKKYRNTDLLLVDDIHFLAGKERLQEEFFHTFNTLFDAHKQIVMTSDRPASEITGLEQRLVSRFEWGLVTELEPPDMETRIAILKNKMVQMKTTLPDDSLLFIAQNIKSNIRRLEGALTRVLSYKAIVNKELAQDALRYLLRDVLEEEQKTEITLETIQRAVAEHYDIRLADMTSKRRPRSIAVPRQVAMFLCRRMTTLSLPDIANGFGKTHATVMHACTSVNSRMDVDSNLKRDVTQISEKLGHPLQ